MASELRYRRVVLTVRGGGLPAPAFRLAAELAHWLELELEGVFLEDEALLALAGHPFAREFSLLGHTWQALDPKRMLEDFRLTAEQTQRLLADAASSLGMASAFSVQRGDLAALAERFLASDILVTVPTAPPAPAESLFRCAAAMMLIPPRPRAAPGPIAAVPDGIGLATATALARRSGETLLLIQPGESEVAPVDLPPDRVRRRRVPANDAEAIAHAVRAANAKLLVIERAAVPNDPAALATACGVPVLIVGDRAEEKASTG